MANAIGTNYLAIQTQTGQIERNWLGGEPEEWFPFYADILLMQKGFGPDVDLYRSIQNPDLFYAFHSAAIANIGKSDNWGNYCTLTPEQMTAVENKIRKIMKGGSN